MLTGCKDDTSTAALPKWSLPGLQRHQRLLRAPKAAKNVSLGIRFSKPDNKEKFELVMAALDEMQAMQDMPMRPKDSKARRQQ